MDRDLWTQELSARSCPAWPCGVCRKGTVALVPGSLVYKETVESVRSRNDENFEFEWTNYIFTAWAKCTHPGCKEEYAISGLGGIAPQIAEDDGWTYEDYFTPKSCLPMPDIFTFPPKCPDDVTLEVRGAFATFWVDRAACAGRLRVALENLMTHLGVPRRKRGAHGKFSDLSLHGRIDAYAKQKPTIGSQLMALKWLGNAGSHDSNVSTEDLLDAFEIMEHALKEMIGGHSARVADLAKKLTKKHGK